MRKKIIDFDDIPPILDHDSEDPPELNPILDEDAPLPDRIEAFARLRYSPEQIAAALGYNKLKTKAFLSTIQDELSEEHRAYQKGLILGDAEIDIGLAKAARGGDNFCASELLKRQEQRKVDTLMKDLFNL